MKGYYFKAIFSCLLDDNRFSYKGVPKDKHYSWKQN